MIPLWLDLSLWEDGVTEWTRGQLKAEVQCGRKAENTGSSWAWVRMTPGVIEDGTHSHSGTYPCLDSSPRAMSYSFHSARVQFSCSDPLENLGPIFHQTNTVGMTQLASRMCVTKSAQLWETQAHTCRKQSLGLHFQTLAQRETAGRQTKERCHGPYTMSPAAPWRWQPAKGRVYSSYHQDCALSSGKDVRLGWKNDFFLHRQDSNLVTVVSCTVDTVGSPKVTV